MRASVPCIHRSWKSRSLSNRLGYSSWFSWKYRSLRQGRRSGRSATSSDRFNMEEQKRTARLGAGKRGTSREKCTEDADARHFHCTARGTAVATWAGRTHKGTGVASGRPRTFLAGSVRTAYASAGSRGSRRCRTRRSTSCLCDLHVGKIRCVTQS